MDSVKSHEPLHAHLYEAESASLPVLCSVWQMVQAEKVCLNGLLPRSVASPEEMLGFVGYADLQTAPASAVWASEPTGTGFADSLSQEPYHPGLPACSCISKVKVSHCPT